MIHSLVRLVETLAWALRGMSALSLLTLTTRYCWLASAEALDHWKSASNESEEPISKSPERRRSSLESLSSPEDEATHRPDLEKLQELAGKAPTMPNRAPTRRARSLLVDLGPERSVVYVNGRKVGQTPYGGELICTDGEEVLIQVLPGEGAPLARKVRCTGDSFTAQDEK